jgi:ABC-type nickel/cobalt efflux system permease component RcnA
MTKHNHEHAGAGKHAHQHKEKTGIRNLHKDWRTWLAVGLMLAAIAIYVLTLDDSVVPVVQTGNQSQTTATTAP